MSKNAIQFQRGISLIEFIKDFGSEEQCVAHLEKLKWPEGFICEACDCRSCTIYQSGSRQVYQCKNCRKNHRLTAGTLFHRTKVPLLKWFIAIREITQSKNSVSTLELHRHLDVNYKTAWLMKQKIMQLMYESDKNYKLEGRVEIDDAYLGGAQTGGKRGRGSSNKCPFIAAVQCDENKHPIFVKLTPVEGFTTEAVKAWAKDNLQHGCRTVSDGLACFNSLDDLSKHSVLVTSKAKKEDVKATFKWVNTILSNVKTSILGTFHSLKYSKYACRYLADLQFRINRRFDLRKMFFGLLSKAIKSQPRPAKVLAALLTG